MSTKWIFSHPALKNPNYFEHLTTLNGHFTRYFGRIAVKTRARLINNYTLALTPTLKLALVLYTNRFFVYICKMI